MDLTKMRKDLLAEQGRLDSESQRIGSILKAMDGAPGQPYLVPKRNKRTLSQAVKNRIAKAQRARWAKVKKTKPAKAA